MIDGDGQLATEVDHVRAVRFLEEDDPCPASLRDQAREV
jgi:hypothetical protein